MKKIITLALCLGLGVLGGCATHKSLDELPPMPAAEPSVDDVNLANGMDEPNPVENDPAQAQENNDLWVRLRQGYNLDLSVENDRIRVQRDWYARHPQYFTRVTTRSERYLHYIIEQAKKRNMPLELALLPFIESAYNPQAISSAQAAGLWQFIPSTGRNFSLRQDWWYDGRRDITASTGAALDYLTLLNGYFDGDWLLALAAYNCGEGCVGRAIKRNEALGLPTDYWNLQLPRETMNYVPKLLALAQIVDSPTAYGTVLPSLANEPYFAGVAIDQQIDLHKVAELHLHVRVEEPILVRRRQRARLVVRCRMSTKLDHVHTST